MKFQNLFSGKNKKNIINLLSVKLAQRVEKDKALKTSKILTFAVKRLVLFSINVCP